MRPLSPRQLDIARRIALGQRRRVIACELRISVKTVDRHVEDILERIGKDARLSAREQIARWWHAHLGRAA